MVMCSEAFIVTNRGFSLCECQTLVEVKVFVLLTDLVPHLLRQRGHEHLAKVGFADTLTMHISLPYPFAHMGMNVLHVFAGRERVEVTEAMQFALLGTSLMLEVERAPEFKPIAGLTPQPCSLVLGEQCHS